MILSAVVVLASLVAPYLRQRQISIDLDRAALKRGPLVAEALSGDKYTLDKWGGRVSLLTSNWQPPIKGGFKLYTNSDGEPEPCEFQAWYGSDDIMELLGDDPQPLQGATHGSSKFYIIFDPLLQV